MIKESNIAIFSLLMGFVVVFCDISKTLEDRYMIAIAIIGSLMSSIALILSLVNKKKIRSKRDKYIFAIIISTISLVFNLFLLISLILFSLMK